MKTNLTQPAASPDPVSLDRVDDQTDHARIYTISRKFCPLCHSPGNDRCRCRTKDQIEYKVTCICKSFSRSGDKLFKMQEQIQIWLAEQTKQCIFSHHQSISQKGKHNSTDAEIHQVLHDDIAGILCAGKSRLHHGKTCLHPKYQGCTN